MSEPIDPATTWGRCSFCGDAVPPQAATCPICGSGNPVRAGELDRASARTRLRLRLLAAGRLFIILAVIVGLGYLTLQPLLTGPPVIADPLTQSGTYGVQAGNYTVFAGEITGEDFVTGNFTVLAPVAAWVTIVIYNTSEFTAFQSGINGGNQSWIGVGNEVCAPYCSGLLDFAAPYTDTFYFVLVNPFPATSPLNEWVYVATQYETNVITFS